jgi:hypothetical protein
MLASQELHRRDFHFQEYQCGAKELHRVTRVPGGFSLMFAFRQEKVSAAKLKIISDSGGCWFSE